MYIYMFLFCAAAAYGTTTTITTSTTLLLLPLLLLLQLSPPPLLLLSIQQNTMMKAVQGRQQLHDIRPVARCWPGQRCESKEGWSARCCSSSSFGLRLLQKVPLLFYLLHRKCPKNVLQIHDRRAIEGFQAWLPRKHFSSKHLSVNGIIVNMNVSCSLVDFLVILEAKVTVHWAYTHDGSIGHAQ